MTPNKPVCDIIILTIDCLNYLKPCLESLEKHTALPVNVFLVDNGSQQETRDFLDNIKNTPLIHYKVIHHPHNTGFVGGNNDAVKKGTSEYICLLNNDTILTHGWLEKLIDTFEKEPRCGTVIPFTNVRENQLGGLDLNAYAKKLEETERGVFRDVGVAPAYCLLIKRSTIEKYGLFNEEIDTAYFEDADLCFRLRTAGLRNLVRRDAFVYHHEHGLEKSSEAWRKKKEALYEKNKQWFLKTWGKNLKLHAISYPPRSAGYKTVIEELCLNECLIREVFILSTHADEIKSWGTVYNLKRIEMKQTFALLYFILYSLFKFKKPFDAILTNNERILPSLEIIKRFRGIPLIYISDALPTVDAEAADWVIDTGNIEKKGRNILRPGELAKLRKLLI